MVQKEGLEFMIFQELVQGIGKIGYQRVPINVPEIYVYHKMAGEQSCYVFLADTDIRGNHNIYSVQGMVLQLSYKLRERDSDCEFLSIVMTNEIDQDRRLASMEQSVWFIDTNQQRLIIYENQKDSCFQDLRAGIEGILAQKSTLSIDEMESTYDSFVNHKTSNQQKVRTVLRKIPFCCTGIIVVNVLVFLVMELFMSDAQYNQVIAQFGSMWTAVRYHKEYYRFVTSIFLHSGMEHLFQNMLILFFVGQILEKVISKSKFLVIYFASGIIADAVSMGYNMVNNRSAVSVGASGAIFGLIGAMLYIVIRNKGRLHDISIRQMVLFVGFSLYGGFASSNVDNAAHVGGFLAGFILAALLIRRNKQKEREEA